MGGNISKAHLCVEDLEVVPLVGQELLEALLVLLAPEVVRHGGPEGVVEGGVRVELSLPLRAGRRLPHLRAREELRVVVVQQEAQRAAV